ncbi:hypothetical protein COV93_03845 [Candidatus Woesearchaeota archaeon CG11_big_fil_rev_8_21_14_0_20_43_8]|nr:MAG: hypothetical protein COV93_03845 [Candidatus Woesearchaeota archaeon CG11_big_fil_rev_8_21_14_0_20_43_8]PIO06542.1 MAG: hypothetical protein COT47_03360 [Candidatus Woesearchaeota archaeon CG08_land_8_20_14_0_20_43_7]
MTVTKKKRHKNFVKRKIRTPKVHRHIKKPKDDRRDSLMADLDSYLSNRRKLEERGKFYDKFIAQFSKDKARYKEDDFVEVEPGETEHEEHETKSSAPGLFTRIRLRLKGIFSKKQENYEIDFEDDDIDSLADEEPKRKDVIDEPVDEEFTDGAKIAKEHQSIFAKILHHHSKKQDTKTEEDVDQKEAMLMNSVKKWIKTRDEDDPKKAEEKKPKKPQKKTDIDDDINGLVGIEEELEELEEDIKKRHKKKR